MRVDMLGTLLSDCLSAYTLFIQFSPVKPIYGFGSLLSFHLFSEEEGTVSSPLLPQRRLKSLPLHRGPAADQQPTSLSRQHLKDRILVSERSFQISSTYSLDISFIIILQYHCLGFIIFLMFASPIKTFRKVVKRKSTESYKGTPYVTTLLSTSFWTYYGLLKPGALLVVTVNDAGVALHIIYVSLYLIYAPRNVKVKYMKLVTSINIGILGAVLLVTQLAFHGSLRITVIGILCAALTIGMYAAPLSAMRTVIRTESVKYMPFTLSLFQFLNGGVWSAYALLVKDIYIAVPNGVGFCLGAAQLLLYTIYRNKSISNDQKEEEGSAHLFKGNISNESMKNRSLKKENSLPKSSSDRQYTQNITKTSSLSPYELGALNQRDIENGFQESH